MIDIVEDPVELVDADALLLPVDGQICRLGGAHPQARAIDGVARWGTIVVSAAS
jgi:hypothetical protein